jgi:hypothetical protein
MDLLLLKGLNYKCSAPIQGCLTLYILIGPWAKQCTGAHIYTTTHRNITVNVDKINHIFIALVLPPYID